MGRNTSKYRSEERDSQRRTEQRRENIIISTARRRSLEEIEKREVEKRKEGETKKKKKDGKAKEKRKAGGKTEEDNSGAASNDQRNSRPSTPHDGQSETERTREDREAKFVDTHRSKLIQRVAEVMPIADELHQRRMIPDELYSTIRTTRTRQEQMRELYEALTSGGEKVKSAFYRILQEKEPHLVQDLEGVATATPCSATKQRVKDTLKDSLKKRCRVMFEGTTQEKTLLNSVYTELYITDGESEEVNTEHEIRRIESLQKSSVTSINCNDIFKPRPEQEESIRTLLTKGMAGIGKTVSVQKFILDWAEGKANQDIDFIFVLPFRELNLIQDDQYSLHDLLCYFHAELTEIADASMFASSKVLFIFDGLDESKLPFSFRNKRLNDLTETSSVDMLLTNLIKGHLFPSALLWITTRPAAANKIERQCIDQMTEVRGFTDQQKEKYFRKQFSEDEELANKIIDHIKKNRSLYIMCYIPIMCYITAKVLAPMLSKNKKGEIPTSLTEMYIHFLITQTGMALGKYEERKEKDQSRQKILKSRDNDILKLSQLAFQQLLKGNLIFTEEDLNNCGIDFNEAAVESGLCTEILKKEDGLYEKKVYSFVHLSFQEFLAAVYVFYCCVTKNISSLESLLENVSTELPLHEVLKRVVDEALQSENGHLDLFLRFLLGISLESNQTLLQGLLPQTERSSETVEEMKKYLRKPDVENLSPERQVNLFLCLTEMKDSSVHEDIHKFLMSPDRDKRALSGDHCSALANALLMSQCVLDEMDLRKYNIDPWGHNRLIPAVRKCRRAILTDMTLSHEDCESLATTLQTPDCPLRELHLKNISIFVKTIMKAEEDEDDDDNDDEISVVFTAMRGPHCKLETLRLTNVLLNHEEGKSLASSLQSPDCPLRELHLKNITWLGDDDDLKVLCSALTDPHCKMETLRLDNCFLTENSCEELASTLSSNPSHLTELDLSHNDLHDSGVKLLSDGLKSPNCRLKILRLSFCRVTEEGCAALASALRSNPSHLRELDLSYNHPGDSGVELLSDPLLRLEKLNVDHNEEIWVKPQLLKKYACDLSLDPNTAHRKLSLSEDNRRVESVKEDQLYPDHPERFDRARQVLCREGLTGRHYWEVALKGEVLIGVTYKSICRKGDSRDYRLGWNDKSWRLGSSTGNCSVWHNQEQTILPDRSAVSGRIGVFLDWSAGVLSFYSISSDTMTHLYTFHTTFTEPLYPAFGLSGSVTLCQVE